MSTQENVRKESRSGRDSSLDAGQSSARGVRYLRGEIRHQAKQLAWPRGKENTHKTHNLNTIKLMQISPQLVFAESWEADVLPL